MDYCFREVSGTTLVTGFDDNEGPVKAYVITGNKCSCPAHVPWCKHLDMKDQLLKSGGIEGRFINEETREMFKLPTDLEDDLRQKTIEELVGR